MQLDAPLHDDEILLDVIPPSAVDGAYGRWMHDPEILLYLEARFSDRSPEALHRFLTSCAASPTALLLGIFLRADGRHVGNIKLAVDPHHLRGDIGILIGDRSVRNRGLATRAICLLRDHAFGPMKLRKLTAGCYGPNQASLRAFQKAGFVVEATRKSHFLCEGQMVDGLFMGLIAPSDN